MGAILIHLAKLVEVPDFVVHSIAISMLIDGALVLYATNARHPGWAGLFAVAALCWLA